MTLPEGDPTSLGLRLGGGSGVVPAAGVPGLAGWWVLVQVGGRGMLYTEAPQDSGQRRDRWGGLPPGHTQAAVLNAHSQPDACRGRPVKDQGPLPGSLATDRTQDGDCREGNAS